MTHTPDADDYWSTLTRSRGVGSESFTFMGDTFRRPDVSHADSIHSTGVLESLIGGSKILDLSVHGRRITRPGGHAEWFLMDISPVYNTWNVEYEGGHSDANLGRAGLLHDQVTGQVRQPERLVWS